MEGWDEIVSWKNWRNGVLVPALKLDNTMRHELMQRFTIIAGVLAALPCCYHSRCRAVLSSHAELHPELYALAPILGLTGYCAIWRLCCFGDTFTAVQMFCCALSVPACSAHTCLFTYVLLLALDYYHGRPTCSRAERVLQYSQPS